CKPARATGRRRLMGGVEGRVVRVRGSVVDVDFAFALPALRTILMVESQEEVPVEVIAHVDDQTARCVALSATQGMARGDAVRNTGAPLSVRVSQSLLGRMFNVFGMPIDGGEPVEEGEWWP